MKIGYTEFSYGYAFTENLIRSTASAPMGAPVFPNLIQEAQTGYDIHLNFPGVPLFFQFKLPELMRKSTAYEIAKCNCVGLNVPFFRISSVGLGLLPRDGNSSCTRNDLNIVAM
jgi:hypothetical protein